MDLQQIAREIVADHEKHGRLGGIDAEVKAQLIADYADRLEDIINRIILEEITRLGKVREFERILDDGGADTEAYLRRTIPNYHPFVLRAVAQAKKEITG